MEQMEQQFFGGETKVVLPSTAWGLPLTQPPRLGLVHTVQYALQNEATYM